MVAWKLVRITEESMKVVVSEMKMVVRRKVFYEGDDWSGNPSSLEQDDLRQARNQ